MRAVRRGRGMAVRPDLRLHAGGGRGPDRARDGRRGVHRQVRPEVREGHGGDDRDVIALDRAGGRVGIALFGYRNGLLVHSRPYIFADHERDGAELMGEFIARYYERESPPREILADPLPANLPLLTEWLGERREGKCEISLAQRGERLRPVEIAHENCRRLLEQHLAGQKSVEEIKSEIAERLHLETAPDPIECYDISTIQGFATVGSKVAFNGGQPDKSRYRRYRIKSVEGQDDFGSLREMLVRRFRKAVESGEPLPGFVLIDGGKGQLNVAVSVFEELGITGVGLASIAKSRLKRRGDKQERTEERFFLPGRKNPVIFPANSPALYLLQQIRDEAHRFGITFHRELRSRRNLRSTLECVPGVGKKRAAILLKSFGSLRALREATIERIAATPDIPATLAETIFEFLHKNPPPQESFESSTL
ncbi:hypothetical protein HYR69_09620 [Candidatus Sumerlaeota bacterium]|nr:hypothetical protein [Candidatus Sumerlaeota bacterium]